MEKLGYTRNTQKLIYWLIYDFANFWEGNKAGASPSTYYKEYAKTTLKKLFLKAYDGFAKENDSLDKYLELLKDKDKFSIGYLQQEFLKALQGVFLNNDDFSLALNLLTQKQANDFVKYMLDLAFKYGVEIRQEIVELLKQEEHDSWIYITLKYKKCCICGNDGELQHFDRVGSYGYKSDTGMNYRVMCLCRKHHHEADDVISRSEFVAKYGYKGIYLKPKQVEKLKVVYPNHFKAYEKEKRYE